MAAIDDLNAAVTNLQTEQNAIATAVADLVAEVAKLQAAISAGNDAAIEAAATSINAVAAELQSAAANGLSMLVAQGEAAFAIWTGQSPPTGCLAGALAGLGMPGIP